MRPDERWEALGFLLLIWFVGGAVTAFYIALRNRDHADAVEAVFILGCIVGSLLGLYELQTSVWMALLAWGALFTWLALGSWAVRALKRRDKRRSRR